MTDEVTGPHSKIEAEGAWNNDNPEDKINRSVPVWYDLDKYVIRRVDGKVVGIAGYSDKGTYAILGGMKSKEGSKSWKPMSEKRLELIGDKPKIAGFKAKNIPNEKWKDMNRQVYNFDIPPKDEMGIDSELIEQFKQRYGDDYGIKKWFELLKLNPSGDYGEDARIRDKADSGTAYTKQPESEGKTAIMFSPHYMASLSRNKKTDKVINAEIENKLQDLVSGTGDYYWFYLNANVADFSFGMIQIIRGQNTRIPRTKIKVKSLLDENRKPYQNVILFTHSNAGRYQQKGKRGQYKYPANSEKVDINFKGIKRGHKKQGEYTKRGEKKKSEFSELKDLEDWVRVFIESLYEMQGMLDTAEGDQWIAITNLIQLIAYKGKEAKNRDILKIFNDILQIIRTKYGARGKILEETLKNRIEFKRRQLYG